MGYVGSFRQRLSSLLLYSTSLVYTYPVLMQDTYHYNSVEMSYTIANIHSFAILLKVKGILYCYCTQTEEYSVIPKHNDEVQVP